VISRLANGFASGHDGRAGYPLACDDYTEETQMKKPNVMFAAITLALATGGAWAQANDTLAKIKSAAA
jgi:uncharacterized ferredoxin-like protein